MPYFRRPAHVFLLIGATVFTYGIGGLVYWLVKRNARICPNCGLDWERARLAPAGSNASQSGGAMPGSGLPSGGGGRRVMGVAMLLVALLLVFLGIGERGSTELFAFGGALAGAGAVTFWWGWNAMQARREELMRRFQTRALHLAAKSGGRLTVTELAHDLELSLTAAERILVSMEDGFRVRSDVTDEGLLLFEFPELVSRGEGLPPGERERSGHPPPSSDG